MSLSAKQRKHLVATTLLGLACLGLCVVVSACGGSDSEPADDSAKAAAKDGGKTETKTAEPAKPESLLDKAEEKIEQAVAKSGEIKVEDVLKKSEEAEKGPLDEYAYDPINKVDPFAASTTEAELPASGGADENILTKYEIRYFRLVGVVHDEAQPRAIFEDPKGKSYVVAVGTPIGRNLGVIDAILNDSVIVTEKRVVPGSDGVIETVPLNIKLHPEREQEGTAASK
ncbi:MAG: pilus assembly protein PilP [Deltaproteobacteria bacterium]|nr:pilus assembly protein PilP [Deltaproteobacteria bacterium]